MSKGRIPCGARIGPNQFCDEDELCVHCAGIIDLTSQVIDLEETIANLKRALSEERARVKRAREVLQAERQRLTEREAYVLCQRLPCNPWGEYRRPMTFREISQTMGISVGRTREIFEKAARKLVRSSPHAEMLMALEKKLRKGGPGRETVAGA